MTIVKEAAAAAITKLISKSVPNSGLENLSELCIVKCSNIFSIERKELTVCHKVILFVEENNVKVYRSNKEWGEWQDGRDSHPAVITELNISNADKKGLLLLLADL